MAQSRTDITFGDLSRGFQIGINSGPIHLPPERPATLARDPLNLAYATDAPFNSYQTQHEPSCLDNTRVDILHDIHSWADGNDRRHIFWLNGFAGTGKSTIARTVARRYFEKKRLGASFFFTKGGGDVGHAGKFVTSVAVQLAESISPLYWHIRAAVNECTRIEGLSLYDQWHHLVIRPLLKLDGSDCHSSYVLVLDALDECDDYTNIRIILKLLAESRVLRRVRLRVFLTSRPETQIRYGFNEIPNPERQDFVLHSVSSSTINHDISIFLEYNLRQIGQEDEQEPGWPGIDAIQRLNETASGLFIWAATACRFIREGPFAEERLQMLLEGGNDPSTPQGHLDKIYITVLQNSIKPSYSEQERQKLYSMLRLLLGSIVVLVSPLSTISLSILLRTTKRQVNQTLNNIHAILEIPRDQTGHLCLHHPSFRDFLLDSNRCRDTNLHVDEKEAHRILAARCIQMMSESLKQDICGLNTPGMLVTDVSSSQVERSLPPELQYACLYWIQHLQRSGAQLYDNHPVHQFLHAHLLHWIEALGWMQKVSEGIHTIVSLESIAAAHECPLLSEFIHDTRRFVLYSRPAIEQAPLQIYCSALIFAPAMSVVRKQFNSCVPRWIRRSLEVENNWNALQQTLEGHLGSVNTVTFSPDGKLLASASDDGTVKLWDAGSGTALQTLKSHSSPVNSISFSPDSKLLASASNDQTVKLWDSGLGVVLQTLEGHLGSVNTVTFSLDGKLLASASDDGTVRLWDASSGAVLQTLNGQMLKGYSSSFNSVALSPDSKLLASASDDYGTAKLWDAGSGAVKQTLNGHRGPVTGVTFSPDGKLLASASYDQTVRLWDASSGAVLQTLKSHSSPVNSISFSPDSKLLASASNDETVKLWDSGLGVVLQTLKGHSDAIMAVAFSPDGKLLASASKDLTVKLWDVGLGEVTQIPKAHSGWVNSVAFSLDGKLLASASDDQTVKLWDASLGVVLQTLEGHSHLVSSVAFSPDGKLLASASDDRIVKLWDAGSGTALQTLKSHLSSDSSMAFIPGHKLLAFSQDGKLLASASLIGTIKVWATSSGAALLVFEGDEDNITAMAFSPESKLLASSSLNGTVKVWDTSSGVALWAFKGHSVSVRGVAFSPDCMLLASTSDDRTVRLWDAGSGVALSIFKGHLDSARAVVFLPGSKLLVSASDDQTVRLWDVNSGVALHSFNVDAIVMTLSCSGDGTFLQTNRGALPTAILLDRVARPNLPHSIFVKQQWVCWGMENILWLPPEHRPSHLVIHKAIIAFGYKSGRVSFIEFAF